MFHRRTLSFFLPFLCALVLFFQTSCSNESSNKGAEKSTTVNSKESSGSELAPDFTLELLDGGTFNLSDHRGSPVLLNFFASWCIPCGAESPTINKVYQEYGKKGVVFVGVAINDTETKAKKFVEKFKISFPSGLDKDETIKEAYGLYGMPTTYFIDKEGLISYLHPGGVTERLLHHELDKLL